MFCRFCVWIDVSFITQFLIQANTKRLDQTLITQQFCLYQKSKRTGLLRKRTQTNTPKKKKKLLNNLYISRKETELGNRMNIQSWYKQVIYVAIRSLHKFSIILSFSIGLVFCGCESCANRCGWINVNRRIFRIWPNQQTSPIHHPSWKYTFIQKTSQLNKPKICVSKHEWDAFKQINNSNQIRSTDALHQVNNHRQKKTQLNDLLSFTMSKSNWDTVHCIFFDCSPHLFMFSAVNLTVTFLTTTEKINRMATVLVAILNSFRCGIFWLIHTGGTQSSLFFVSDHNSIVISITLRCSNHSVRSIRMCCVSYFFFWCFFFFSSPLTFISFSMVQERAEKWHSSRFFLHATAATKPACLARHSGGLTLF